MAKKLALKPSSPQELNWLTYQDLYDRLCAIAVNTFKWSGLPPEIDVRFLDLALFGTGSAVFYYEDVVERYVALTCFYSGPLDIYNIPKVRTAYATNGYNCQLTDKNSVLMFNNYNRRPDFGTLELYAMRMANCLRTFDVNMNAQKTPVVVLANDNQRLTMKNLAEQYDGNAPFIYGMKNLDLESVKALSTGAPFIADKAFDMYQRLWEEALNFLGIETVNRVKQERLITDEVRANLGYALAQRYVRMNARTQAAQQINRMFGLDVKVEFRQDLAEIVHEATQSLSNSQGGESLGEVYGRATLAY